jgi:hypothetical protein
MRENPQEMDERLHQKESDRALPFFGLNMKTYFIGIESKLKNQQGPLKNLGFLPPTTLE